MLSYRSAPTNQIALSMRSKHMRRGGCAVRDFGNKRIVPGQTEGASEICGARGVSRRPSTTLTMGREGRCRTLIDALDYQRDLLIPSADADGTDPSLTQFCNLDIAALQ